jgi:hypothetical protein
MVGDRRGLDGSLPYVAPPGPPPHEDLRHLLAEQPARVHAAVVCSGRLSQAGAVRHIRAHHAPRHEGLVLVGSRGARATRVEEILAENLLADPPRLVRTVAQLLHRSDQPLVVVLAPSRAYVPAWLEADPFLDELDGACVARYCLLPAGALASLGPAASMGLPGSHTVATLP